MLKNLKILLPIFALVLAGTVFTAWTDAPSGCSGPGPGCPNTAEPINAGGTNQTKDGGLGIGGILSVGQLPAQSFLRLLNLVAGPGQFLTTDATGRVILGTPSGGSNPLPGENYWSRTSPNLYPATLTDNVGIGTASPTRKLDVIGDIRTSTGALRSPAPYMAFATDLGGALPIKAGSLAITSSYADSAPFRGLYVEGNVGVGTTNATSRLTIGGGGIGNLEFQNANQDIITTAGDSQWARITPRDLTTGDMILTPSNAGGVQRKVRVAGAFTADSICTTGGNCLGGGGGSGPGPGGAVSSVSGGTGISVSPTTGATVVNNTQPNRFGGMYTIVTFPNSFDLLGAVCQRSSEVTNPLNSGGSSNGCSCPSGFTATQIYSFQTNAPIDLRTLGVYYCWK